MKLCHFCMKMDRTGEPQVKWNKSGSENKRPHIFSYMCKTDPKNKHIHKYIWICEYILREDKKEHVYNSGTVWGEWGKEGEIKKVTENE
jgi:hypothetical protein